MKFIDPTTVDTIATLDHEVRKVLLLKDDGIVHVLIAALVANRMALSEAVWLLLVAPSSGGKTEMISFISKLPFIHAISDLTVNTFASGQKRSGQESSLLLKMNNGIMVFKDFTSILSKSKEAKKEIMSQLREIYDGEYVKRTGNGQDIVWRGKLGAIAGATEAVYRQLEDLSAMGDRFIMYSIGQPDRMEVARRALDNARNMSEMREHLRACFRNYLKKVLTEAEACIDDVILGDTTKGELLEVANFATLARSAVLTDFKTGEVDFVPAAEMPMRVTTQLHHIASAFVVMHKAEGAQNPQKLSKLEKKILYKCAFDSIPRTRRDALASLAKYRHGVTTAGLAMTLNLPTGSVRKYLEQVNALGISHRGKKGGQQGDEWVMKDEYRSIMVRLENIEVIDEVLIRSEDEKVEEIEDAFEAFDNAQREEEVDSLSTQDELGIH